MSRVFVIPDVHLKPWIFTDADELVSAGHYDAVVMLGDLVDDWGMERNTELYNRTFDATIAFTRKHPDTFWCYGNHDVSYLWEALESGYSHYMRETVVGRIRDLRKAIPPENSAYIHRVDKVLFSHAGLTEDFVERCFKNRKPDIDVMIAKINRMGESQMWQGDSPLWARPQYGEMKMYPQDMMQVVGHTPVRKVLHEGNLLTLDNFSTYSNGNPIGDQRFVWVDTAEQTWGYADE